MTRLAVVPAGVLLIPTGFRKTPGLEINDLILTEAFCSEIFLYSNMSWQSV